MTIKPLAKAGGRGEKKETRGKAAAVVIRAAARDV